MILSASLLIDAIMACLLRWHIQPIGLQSATLAAVWAPAVLLCVLHKTLMVKWHVT
jgi:hypothetical protein